jgi:hypothetical protein
MPLSLDSGVFDPEAIQALTTAYENACAALHADRQDPLTIIVAKKIIEHAQRGERDPIRLREKALSELQGNPQPQPTVMLAKLSEEIAECYLLASDAREEAAQAHDPALRQEFLDVECRCILLARSYEFTQRLSDF